MFQPAINRRGGAPVECRGNLTVLLSARGGGRGHPRVSEAGRQFFLAQAGRLTDAHVHAVMQAARVDQIADSVWHDPRTGVSSTGAAAWVAVWRDKMAQIAARTCAP